MSTATRPHGARGKRNPDDTDDQLEEMREDAIEFMEEKKKTFKHLAAKFCAQCKTLLDNFTDDYCPKCQAEKSDDS
jgi:hypothetical protein